MEGTRIGHLQCPYCGEVIDVVVDCSVSRQQYIEDCSVCCRPILLTVTTQDGELLGLVGQTEDD